MSVKLGKSIEETVENINQEFDSKVDKTTKIAGIKLKEDVPAEELAPKLFRFVNTISQEVDADGTIHPPTGRDYDRCTNWAPDREWPSVEEFEEFLKNRSTEFDG